MNTGMFPKDLLPIIGDYAYPSIDDFCCRLSRSERCEALRTLIDLTRYDDDLNNIENVLRSANMYLQARMALVAKQNDVMKFFAVVKPSERVLQLPFFLRLCGVKRVIVCVRPSRHMFYELTSKGSDYQINVEICDDCIYDVIVSAITNRKVLSTTYCYMDHHFHCPDAAEHMSGEQISQFRSVVGQAQIFIRNMLDNAKNGVYKVEQLNKLDIEFD